MDKTTLLKRLGFRDHEAEVYLALVQIGSGSPSDIERTARLHRPLVYEALPALIEKGMIKIMPKGKRKLYIAESPEKLAKLFADFEKTFFSDLESLHETYKKAGNKPTVTFAEGKDALQDSYMDVVTSLEKDQKYYRYFSSQAMNRTRFIPKEYRDVRNKKGLERQIITSESARKNDPSLGASVRVVPKTYDLFEYDIGQVIYGNKVAILDYESQTVITIEHPKFAKFQEKVFKLLFSKL